MRVKPSLRNKNNQLRFSTNKKSKKKKDNSKKNRSAMRRKAHIKYLQERLQCELDLQRNKQRATPKAIKRRLSKIKNNERKHNLFFQQTKSDQKEYYAQDHAKLIAQMMTQIKQ